MRSFLRWFLNFMDTRFPQKVHVTLADYEALRKQYEGLRSLHDKHQTDMIARVGALEAAVKALSYQMGFGAKAPGEFSLER